MATNFKGKIGEMGLLAFIHRQWEKTSKTCTSPCQM